MIGQLPPEFFIEFFGILDFKSAEAVAYKEKLHELGQRKFLQEQLSILPEMEQETFGDILAQGEASAHTINEFLEQRLDEVTREALWHDSLLFVWQEVLDTIRDNATEAQKAQIRDLVRKYLIQDE